MSELKMYEGLSIKVKAHHYDPKRSVVEGIYYCDEMVIDNWLDLVYILEVCQMHLRRKRLEKKEYLVGKMSLNSVEKHNIHSLRIELNLEKNIIIFLDEVEVNWLSSVLKRILARVDILKPNSTSSLYNKPIEDEEDLFA